MRKITIETIPHNKQRYDTVGDWQITPDEIRITVSAMRDWRSEFLVAVHELVEVALCIDAEVSQQEVDDWDTHFAKDQGEPGESIFAPYHDQHMRADVVERLLAMWFFMQWQRHCENVEEPDHLYAGITGPKANAARNP